MKMVKAVKKNLNSKMSFSESAPKCKNFEEFQYKTWSQYFTATENK
jgi:hypothetical protein